MTNKTKGFIYGAIAAASYGMNPLFALPLYAAGMSVDTVLFYRYFFATIVLGILMKMQHQSFALHKADVLPLVIMGLLFSFSSLLLFMSYNYMDAGIASTILFVYPVMVAVIMGIFFKEKISAITVFSILLALSGIALLYQGDGNKPLSTLGIIFVLLSSLSYAIYIVGVNRSTLKNLPTTKLTFYAILFGLSVYIVRLNFCTELQVIPSAWLWADVLSLAILPTAVSLVCTALAIHYIGSTPTAILGALEPVTALFFGVLLFHEKLTPRLMMGILMIITAVTLIIIGKSLIKKMGMAIMYLEEALAHIRAGKASARLLDGIRVDSYGSMVPISNVAAITTPDARSIVIKPWDKSMFRVIEKAIIDSDLGIMPENNGEMIRIGIPPLTEERRKQLAKQCKGEGETAKVSVRNARRDGIDALKKAVKDGLAEDEQKNAEAKLQKIHDKYIKQIDDMLAEKEKEIMTV